jgi:hypothetical protein
MWCLQVAQKPGAHRDEWRRAGRLRTAPRRPRGGGPLGPGAVPARNTVVSATSAASAVQRSGMG